MSKTVNPESVGAQLARWIDAWIDAEPDRNQQALAMEWIERSSEEVSATTVPSRLSSLRRDKPDGLRFFFNKRNRAKQLFDLLGVPDAERSKLFAQAADELNGHSRARLLVVIRAEDVTDGQAWGNVKALLEAPETPRPAVVAADEQAFGSAPMTIALIDGCTVVRPEAGEPSKQTAQHAARGGLVVAADWPADVPFEQWIALDFATGEAAPPGWRAAWTAGELATLPVPDRRLDDLDFEATALDDLPRGPELRAALLGIATGEDEREPGQRLAYAARWPVVAAATEGEVVASRIRKEDRAVTEAAEEAGLEPEHLDREEWAGRKMLAGVVETRAVVNVEGEGWVWLNHPPPASVAGLARVTHLEIGASASQLGRLWTAVEEWDIEQRWADPTLSEVASQLDPAGEERDAFRLAREWILSAPPEGWGLRAPEVSPVDEPAAVLEALVAQPAQEVELLFDRSWDEQTLMTRAEVERHGWLHADLVAGPHAPETGRMARTDQLLAVESWRTICWWMQEAGRVAPAGSPEGEIAFVERLTRHLVGQSLVATHCIGVPRTSEEIASALRVQRRLSVPNTYRTDTRDWRYHHYVLDRDGLAAVLRDHTKTLAPKETPFEVQAEVWPFLDIAVEQLRDALARSLREHAPRTLPDGDLLVRLGPGVDAKVTITGHPDSTLASGVAVEVPATHFRRNQPLGLASVMPFEEMPWLHLKADYGGQIFRNRQLPKSVELRSAAERAVVRLLHNPYTA